MMLEDLDVEPSSYICDSLHSIYHDNINCDLCLISEDEEKIYVHGFVVATVIPKIRSIIVGPCECLYRVQPLRLRDVKKRELVAIIEYAYTRRCDVPTQPVLALQLLKAAFGLGTEPLVTKCAQVLHNTLDMECALQIIGPERSNSNLVELQKSAELLVLRNLVHSSSLKSISDVSVLEGLLRDERLNAPFEEQALITMLRWLQLDADMRAVHIGRLLRVLRLGLLAPGSLDVLARHPLVTASASAMDALEIARATMRCLTHVTATAGNATWRLPLPVRPRMPYTLPLLIGGWLDKVGSSSMCDTFDHLSEQWISLSCLNLPDTRLYHGLEIIDGVIYVIGGMHGLHAEYLDTCLRLSLNGSLYDWEPVTSMLEKRCFVATAALNGRIYAIGGRDKNWRHDSVECFDPDKNSWTVLASLPLVTSDASVVPLNGKLYLAGGFSGDAILNQVLMYDPGRNSWSVLPSLNTARSALTLVTLRGFLYALGGFDGQSRCAVVECFDTNAPTEWQERSPMLTARSSFTAVELHGRLLVFGGYCQTGVTNLCELYDPDENMWYPLQTMPVARSGMACCVVDDLAISEWLLRGSNRDIWQPRVDYPKPCYPDLAAFLTSLPRDN